MPYCCITLSMSVSVHAWVSIYFYGMNKFAIIMLSRVLKRPNTFIP